MTIQAMSCIEFRRCLTEAPSATSAELQQHAKQCAACKQFKRQAIASDTALHQAFNISAPDGLGARIKVTQTMAAARDDDADCALQTAVNLDVPAGLATRIMDRTALERARSRRRNTILNYAMAASIAVAVLVGSLLLIRPAPLETQDSSLMSAVVLHSLSHTAGYGHTVPQALLSPVLHMVGLELEQRPRNVITSATACDIEDQRSLHLVMRGEQGPVSVYVMPNQHTQTTEKAQRANLKALLVPVRHGRIAVIGQPREDLSSYAQELKRNLR